MPPLDEKRDGEKTILRVDGDWYEVVEFRAPRGEDQYLGGGPYPRVFRGPHGFRRAILRPCDPPVEVGGEDFEDLRLAAEQVVKVAAAQGEVASYGDSMRDLREALAAFEPKPRFTTDGEVVYDNGNVAFVTAGSTNAEDAANLLNDLHTASSESGGTK